MTVFFIGAGPGAVDLITLRGARILTECPVCLYAGSLVPKELLSYCPDGATLVDTARIPLSDIISHIQTAHDAGYDVARLHSGDPSVYSAVSEQIRELTRREIDFEIVPGVPAFAAAAAALGTELTVPGIGQSVLITRVATVSTDMPDGETLAELGATRVTLALHLAAHRVREAVDDLLPHYGADCPCAVVAFASRHNEQIIRCRLGRLPAQMKDAGIVRTAVIFVGSVLTAEAATDSYLYSHARMTKLRAQSSMRSNQSNAGDPE